MGQRAMCLIGIAFDASHEYSLVLAANRDERHARPAAAAGWWDGAGVLAGRDLEAGGTWLGVDPRGRAAAVANYSEIPRAAEPRSRGALVTDFLRGNERADEFEAALGPGWREAYAGFNLVLFDGVRLHYLSNRAPARALGRGIHAFGNAPPAADWPKMRRARAGLAAWLAAAGRAVALLDLLAEGARTAGPTAHTESLFIRGPEFGTRCSTVLLVRRDGTASFIERRFDAGGRETGESTCEFTVQAKSAGHRTAHPADAGSATR